MKCPTYSNVFVRPALTHPSKPHHALTMRSLISILCMALTVAGGTQLVAPNFAGASLARALDLAELTRTAEHVVVVRVLSEHAYRDEHGRILTDYELLVEDTWKGDKAAGEHVILTRIGGAIGDIEMRSEGESAFEMGERFVLFARVWAEGHNALRPIGSSQGVMPIQASASPDGDDLVLPGGAGLAVVHSLGNGQLAAAPTALLHPRAMNELRTEVQHIVEASHARH